MAKILIVDDDPDVVEAVRLFVSKAGHEVVSAFSRSEGMTRVNDAKPDLLILDVMMEQPDDGIAMAQDLRRAGFKKPIIMLTSVSKALGMSYGRDNDLVPVDEFIEKPVLPAALVEKVTNLLKKS
jgi:DNA-binding response OmpR family regulator